MSGEISLGHCRGHDCIKLVFYLDGFYDCHRHLSSKRIYFRKKIGCFFSNSEPKTKLFDLAPPGDDFEYLRPQGTITFSIDRKYNVILVDIRFDGWYENNVRLWPKHTEQRKHFLLLQKTPLQTPGVSPSSDSGFNTVFLFKKWHKMM